MMKESEKIDAGAVTDAVGTTRREILAVGGATLVATLFAPSVGGAQVAGTKTKNGGTKPVYLPAGDDAVSHSIADTLFWTDQMAEHASFFVLLMPGRELAGPRGRAEKFQASLAAQMDKTRSARLDKSNYVAFNRSTVDLVKPLIDFKREMQDAQESGRMRSLVWPLFFDHTAREGERFVRRLEQLSKGDADLDAAEVVDFWARIMDEHAEFIAHLLDPQEDALIEKALSSSAAFRELRQKRGSKAEADALAKGIIDFKTAAGKGITAGKVKSIIPTALADHVRREAVKFEDELKRA
jgi:hypothetical protein